ncbi:MAG: putative molybdenum carrier protein [Thermodesulfobacteriota bacterium]
MIEKIISGGQTGADRAALDAAIEIGIPHGGWVPKGRLAEDGAVPLSYHLNEMPTDSYAARTEQNVADADGTLIVSHGPLSGGSALTQELAQKQGRPCLHIDLNPVPAFKAAAMVAAWITLHRIKTLNVAGPRASNDLNIYKKTKDILIAAFHIGMAETARSRTDGRFAESTAPPDLPNSIEAAVDLLVLKMPLKDKATIANMTAAEISGLDASLGLYVRTHFGLPSGNSALLESCRLYSETNKISVGDAAGVVIFALWQHLRKTHKLRIVTG